MDVQNREKLSREQIIELYQDDAMKLLQFRNWVKAAAGKETLDIYRGEGIDKSSMTVPVYDENLLNFIRTAKQTQFMNRNYVYTFSKYRIKTAEEEIRHIECCTLQDVKIVGDILSKYCYGGDIKAVRWSEGVKNGVYLAILNKLKELLEVRKPL